MKAGDDESNELLLQIARDHLHGTQVFELSIDREDFQHYYDYRLIDTLLVESFQLGKI
jgi:hypothetical protein